jgi:RNA polymerase sigma-70 factor, ECF subfamily
MIPINSGNNRRSWRVVVAVDQDGEAITMPVAAIRNQDRNNREAGRPCMTADFGSAPEELAPRLRRYVEALVQSRRQADDVVAQAMDRALRGPGGDANRETAAFSAARELCRARMDQRSLGMALRPGQAIDGVAFAGVRQSEVRVKRNFAQLPVDEREVLLLVCVEGFDYGQAAEILGTTKETLVERLVRARFLLHRMVAEEARMVTQMPKRQTSVESHD